MKKRTRICRSANDWQNLLETYHQSDLTQEQFCKQHRLAPSTFAKWKNRLSTEPFSGADDFIDITPTTPLAASVSGFRLELTLSFVPRFHFSLTVA
jgi:hypothetical protein